MPSTVSADRDQDREPTQRIKSTVMGASFGTLIEYFDYGSYAYLAPTIASVFFASGDSTAALVQTLAVFALSFAARPLGGLFWGHFGDRIGRKRTLTITIVGMGIATVAIGLLPGYAAIGLWAPVLLLIARLGQSFCAAGEYSGAAVLLGEHAPPHRRARSISFAPIGNASGLLVASCVATGLHAALSHEAMLSWGWRIPFLAGAPLTIIGWYIRRKLEETPAFLALTASGEVAKTPLMSGLKTHWRTMLRMLCIMGINAGGYYLVLSYMATYIEQEVHLSSFQAGVIVTVALVVYLPLLYVFAGLADRLGRKPVLLANCILLLTLSLPAFLVLNIGGFAVAFAVQLLMVAVFALNDSTFATFFIESFPARVRYSGFAIPFNFGVALFGGTTPLLSAWLIDRTGSSLAPAFIVMTLALVCLGALALSKDTDPQMATR
ncbi:MFS transporter [Streptomyces sp. NPDC047009]|uniref:MFS transporter n=1 Tax=Streptomyces sp. NPDC047009 TaxID=3154496 RepID=UPI0033CE9FFE